MWKLLLLTHPTSHLMGFLTSIWQVSQKTNWQIFIESINEGRRAFERGEYYEFEEVFAELEERFGAYE